MRLTCVAALSKEFPTFAGRDRRSTNFVIQNRAEAPEVLVARLAFVRWRVLKPLLKAASNSPAMKKTLLLGLTAITLALTSSTARAGDVRFSFHIGLPLPRLCVPTPPPPPPVCVAPPVVYVQGSYCRPAFIHRGPWVYHRPVYGHAKYCVVAHPGTYCSHGY
jgi:hypothetical protein